MENFNFNEESILLFYEDKILFLKSKDKEIHFPEKVDLVKDMHEVKDKTDFVMEWGEASKKFPYIELNKKEYRELKKTGLYEVKGIYSTYRRFFKQNKKKEHKEFTFHFFLKIYEMHSDKIETPSAFINKVLNGMTLGIFPTLIIGTIVSQLSTVFPSDWIIAQIIDNFGIVLKSLMGIGIGIGVAMSLKLKGIRLVSLSVAGAIATSFKITFFDPVANTFFAPTVRIGPNNDPVITILVVAFTAIILMRSFKKQTNFDILLIPLVTVAVSGIITTILTMPVSFLIGGLSSFVSMATAWNPILMSIVISVVIGMLLTAPISSVAVSVAINLGGLAAGAALIGCCTQMVGFAVQSIRDNKIGTFFAIFFGTSMLQFKNVVKKPIIWLPTIISSAILGPIGVLFGLETTAVGAGMGTSGLVGIIQTLGHMDYSLMSWLGLLTTCIVGPALLTFIFDLILRKANLIKPGDLKI